MEEKIYILKYLPNAIKTFFLDKGLEDLDEIGEKYGLSESILDQLDIIQQDILFGYESVEDTLKLVQTRLGLEEGIAKQISLDLLRKRLLPIDSYLGSKAFSTYTLLGGDLNVLNIKRVDATGTVIDVRRKMKENQEEVEKARENMNKNAEKEEHDTQKPADLHQATTKQKQLPKLQDNKQRQIKTIKIDQPKKPVENNKIQSSASQKPAQAPQKPEPALQKQSEQTTPKPQEQSELAKPKQQEPAPPLPQKQQVDTPQQQKPPVDTPQQQKPPVDTPQQQKQKRRLRKKQPESPKSAPQQPKQPQPQQKPKLPLPEIQEEAEVAEMMQKLKEAGTKAPQGLEHAKIDEIKRKLSLTFPSSELEKRFRVLAGARLSGVRKQEDFKAALAKPVASGGLELDQHTVERVADEVESHIENTTNTATQKHSKGREALIKENQEKIAKAGLDLTAAPDHIRQRQKTERPEPAPQPTKQQQKPKISQETVIPQAPPGKKPMVDIIPPRKLVGPVEELKQMTIEDFRRMPGSTEEAKTALKEDIDILAKQDPATRIRGIEAWRQSPMVKAYQLLISAALKDGRQILEVIKDETINTSGLTVEEFKAVRALNASLRY